MTHRERHCPITGKRTFRDREQALAAIRSFKRDGVTGRHPLGYKCQRCGHWHLHRLEFAPYKCPHCWRWHLHTNKPPCNEMRTA